MRALSGAYAEKFYLRYLLEYRPPEGDEGIRACRALRSLRVDPVGSDAVRSSSLLQVVIDPPFLMMDTLVTEIMLGEYYAGSGVFLPEGRYLLAMIYRVRDWNGVSRRTVAAEALHTWHAADIARTPDLLPMTRKRSFEVALGHLQRFASREGHTDVPELFVEQGCNLGVWVQNTRRGGVNREEAAQLAGIPEWRWLSSEESALLRSYAEREGHTDPPDTYVVNRLALENLVSQVRRQYASGLVSPEEVRRLEEIPHWHW